MLACAPKNGCACNRLAAMKRRFRLPVPGRKTGVLLGAGLLVLIALALFDWNWLRPALERHLAENSGREIRVGELDVEFGFSLEPTIRLRKVYIQNAAWAASKRPMAVAEEASFTFSLRTLWDERRVITLIVLKDAEVDLEWLPDGRRNWRLREPDDRGPGRYKVLALETHRSSIHYRRPAVEVDITGVSTAHQDPHYPSRVAFHGTYRATAFRGEAFTTDLVTLQDTGKFIPLRGHLSYGKTRLEADGRIADVFKQKTIDGKARASGASLAQLQPFFPVTFPTSAYKADAHLRKDGDTYAFTQLRSKIGATDVAGEFTYIRAKDAEGQGGEKGRPLLRAKLHSELVNLADLGEPGGQAGSDRLFSRGPLGAKRIRAVDAEITIVARKLRSADTPALESLKFSADLADGVLQLKAIDLGFAGGHAVGAVTVDARSDAVSSRAAMDLRGMRLERLVPELKQFGVSLGPVNGSVRVSGNGDSIAAIAGSASGSVSMNIAGGSISGLLDAKLAQNLGRILRLKLGGDRAIDVHCAAVAFEFTKGVGKSSAILLDTEQTRVDGEGTLNLREETLDVLLDPTEKKPGLLSLDKTIHVRGPLKHPEFSLEKSATHRITAQAQCPKA
jgi:uncharacterized protein involved in outer membrane biogenesis